MRNMEPLESRTLRSVTLLADKTLVLEGTTGNDQFEVQMLEATRFEVREYVTPFLWASTVFDLSDVSQLGSGIRIAASAFSNGRRSRRGRSFMIQPGERSA